MPLGTFDEAYCLEQIGEIEAEARRDAIGGSLILLAMIWWQSDALGHGLAGILAVMSICIGRAFYGIGQARTAPFRLALTQIGQSERPRHLDLNG